MEIDAVAEALSKKVLLAVGESLSSVSDAVSENEFDLDSVPEPDLETDSDVVDDLNKLPEAVAELDVSVPDTVADACVPESVTDSETVDACDRLAEDDAACVMEEEFVGLADTVAVVVTDRDTERDTVSASVAVEDTENV